MIKITVTNERIVGFYLNAQFIIKQLSSTGKRTRYLGVLQLMFEFIEEHYKSIQKKANRLEQKFAKTKESGEFIYDGEGDKRAYVYTKADKETLDDEIEKLYKDVKTLEIDEVYYLKEGDLPNDGGVVTMTNSLIKCFSDFVISKELAKKLMYPTLDIEKDKKIEEPKLVKA